MAPDLILVEVDGKCQFVVDTAHMASHLLGYMQLIGIDTEQDPVGLLGTKALLCPPFL